MALELGRKAVNFDLSEENLKIYYSINSFSDLILDKRRADIYNYH